MRASSSTRRSRMPVSYGNSSPNKSAVYFAAGLRGAHCLREGRRDHSFVRLGPDRFSVLELQFLHRDPGIVLVHFHQQVVVVDSRILVGVVGLSSNGIWVCSPAPGYEIDHSSVLMPLVVVYVSAEYDEAGPHLLLLFLQIRGEAHLHISRRVPAAVSLLIG